MKTNSSGTVLFLYKHRKSLIIIGICAAVLASMFSSSIFITPLFQSSVIMYPASSNSISRSLLNKNSAGKYDMLEFGEENQADQMMQILNSNKIKDKIISKFSLANHYDIVEGAKYAQTLLYKQYESNIGYKQTKYSAVEILVMDSDPEVAAGIANEIAVLFDSVKNNMQQERALKGFKIIQTEYLSKLSEVNSMEDSLTQLRMLGIHDYESQAEMMNQQLAMEISKGNQAGIKALEEKLKLLAKYGGAYVSIRDALEYEKKQLSYLKSRHSEAKIDATRDIPQKFIIENAYASDKKVYPIRWIIVILSTMFALICWLGVLYFMDIKQEAQNNIRRLNIRATDQKNNRVVNFSMKKKRIHHSHSVR